MRLPDRPTSRWHRAGVTPRTERWLDAILGAVLLVFAAGWTWSIAVARASEVGDEGAAATAATAAIAAGLTDPDAPAVAFLTDETVRLFEEARGESGRLRALVDSAGTPLVDDSLPSGASLTFSSDDTAESTTAGQAPSQSGVWQLAIRVGNALKPLTDLSVITLTPFSEKRKGRIGLYYIGNWPTERGRKRAGYVTPSGFIEVTQENQDTPVSDHFVLSDFLTHDQANVWPKYLVLDMRLVDKLELVLSDLEARGIRVDGARVMSGFRTPQYNAGGGDPRGRASFSRHMYGDAADIFIDSDGNGQMDDLNRDRRVNIRDSEVILGAVDRVERAHPGLVGGAGVYRATAGHGPFIHIDVRGFRARWIGTGDS